MVFVDEHLDTGIEEPSPWWSSPVTIGAAVVIGVVTAVIVIGIGGGEEPGPDPVATFEAYAAHIEDGDIDALLAGSSLPSFDTIRLLEWMAAVNAEPDFTSCWSIGRQGEGDGVRCAVTFGEDFFYSRVMEQELVTEVSGVVTPDASAQLSDWPLPAGVARAAGEFREWIAYEHPEIEQEVFDDDRPAGLRLSSQAGEHHRTLLDGYLAYLADPPLRQDEVFNRLAMALATGEPDQLGDVRPDGFALGFEGGEHFLEAQITLGMDPSFSECRLMESILPLIAECQVDMGPDYFYAQLVGAPITTRVIVDSPLDGTFQVASWPPSEEMWNAEYELLQWISDVAPELEEPMFGQSGWIFEFTAESARLHMEVLEEFLADRDG